MVFLKKRNWIMLILLLLWCTITLIRVLYHSPWYDEAHAWLISQELNIFEIIKLMKIEGHTFIWYLLLMPFAKTNFMYPYSMLLLNWLFCFIAVLILWLKAPFNNWIKFLISFSFPFLAMYPVVARCYSIGIMFLFAIAAQEKSKLAHPNWYALLLILCANTSVMAAVGAMTFGILYIKDIFVQKRKLSEYMLSFLILIFGAGTILFQLHGASNDIVWAHVPFGSTFFKDVIFYNVFFKKIYLNIFMLILLLSFYVFFYILNKKIPYFLLISYITLFTIICVYSGNLWHHFFFYIYLVISTWIFTERCDLPKIKMYNLLTFVLGFISFLYILYQPAQKDINFIWHDKSKILSQKILNEEDFKDSTLIITTFEHYSLIPYLKNKNNIKVVNYCSAKVANYDTVPFSRAEFCHAGTDDNFVYLKYKNLNKCYEKNSYMFAYKGMDGPYYDKNSDSIIYVREYKKLYDNMYLYKLEKVNLKK